MVEAIEDIETQQLSYGSLGRFLSPTNFQGQGSHICNAGFIVQPQLRSSGYKQVDSSRNTKNS